MSRQDRQARQAEYFGRLQRVLEPSEAADRIAHSLIGAAIEVHRHLGPGFLESAYERALAVELGLRGIPFAQQVPIVVAYKGVSVSEQRLDLLVDDLVILEIKAVESITSAHVVQALSYMRAARLELGLLINFNVPVLTQGIRRLVRPIE
ncbi:MAG TPA: GxxExxY protein [Kofleriaceae bacterium]|nr:GxxExxY protein [Kofleriaceae bacterium]